MLSEKEIVAPERAVGEWTEDYLANCCHILGQESGTASLTTPAPPALCGRRPSHPKHVMNNALDMACPTCGRPRCPECANRYSKGQR